MTDHSLSATLHAGRDLSWRRGMVAGFRDHEPRFFALGALLLLAAVPTGFAALVDGREFLGVDVWQKPLKFEIALFVYLMTLTFFARWLSPAMRASRRYRWYANAVVVAIAAEMVWILGAAALGTASHFNTSPVGAAIYPLMGAAAVLLTSATAVYAVGIARNRATGLPPAIKEGLVLGLALALPLTLVTAGTMSSLGGHAVGGSGSDAGGLALMGWARDGGDLRVAHFFATHAMHFIPVFGLASATAFGGAKRTPVRLFAAAFVLFVAYAFVEALLGRSFLPWLGA